MPMIDCNCYTILISRCDLIESLKLINEAMR